MDDNENQMPKKFMIDLTRNPLIIFKKVTPSCIIGGGDTRDCLKYLRRQYGKPLRVKTLCYDTSGQLAAVETQSHGKCITVRLDRCGVEFTLSFTQHEPRAWVPIGKVII